MTGLGLGLGEFDTGVEKGEYVAVFDAAADEVCDTESDWLALEEVLGNPAMLNSDEDAAADE